MSAKENEVIRSLVDSLDVSGWTLSNEREFTENLYVGRFSSFMLVFSLFLTAGFANSFQTYKSVVFYGGAGLLYLIWLPLYRAYQKHDRIMRIIFSEKVDHPAAKIEAIMHLEGYSPKYRVSRHMGVTIPWACMVVLICAGAATSGGLLR